MAGLHNQLWTMYWCCLSGCYPFNLYRLSQLWITLTKILSQLAYCHLVKLQKGSVPFITVLFRFSTSNLPVSSLCILYSSYLGRKRLNRKDEIYLEGTDSLVWPSYSYWTLSYLLSNSGARKLLAQKPLQNLLPVDEYLPVMFDQHPE